MEKSRLIIVANRLPVTVSEENGAQPCSGGLVSAIDSYLDAGGKKRSDFDEVFWAGCPGCSPSVWQQHAHRLPKTNYEYIPAFVTQKDYEGYYNGFSNSTLWPLFHYFPSYVEYNDEHYEQYKAINWVFAETLLNYLRPGDTVWIHDYHLLPLAGLLRKAMPALTIGFFLHIPFPSFELFRLLPRPWQTELLEGMLGADLVGFHTIDYAAHFLQSVQSILGLDNHLHTVQYNDRLVKVDVFPISIDYEKFHSGYELPEVAERRKIIQSEFQDKKIMFSIDRLDYTKGIYNRLAGYELFLQKNPEYREKVVLVVVIIPSRDMIGKYVERKKMIDETISSINSRLGNLHWQPVIYRYNSISFEELIALYTCSHLALVTPLRDGMNLIAKEFVSSRKDHRGVLVLSEMAGAARELTEALSINPNDINEIAAAIGEGLEMSPEEQGQRLQAMQQRIAGYDVRTWANDFLHQLDAIKARQENYKVSFLDEYSGREIVSAYRAASKRLLLLDYDGTLVPFAPRPEDATPGPELMRLVEELCSDTRNDIYIISGRDAAFLNKWFGRFAINLIAEHGARVRLSDGGWISRAHHHYEWKGKLRQIMENYAKRCPLTFVEEKEYSVAWHFRNASQDQAKLRCAELLTEVNEFTRNLDLQVLMGNKVLEVRKHGINKGIPVRKMLSKGYDFILAAGDDETDEDVFKVLDGQPGCYTIKIGSSASYAAFNLSTPAMMIALLRRIGHVTRPLVTIE